MGRIAKFTSQEIDGIVQYGVMLGPNAAARALNELGVKITAGGVYYWMQKAGKVPKKSKK